MMTVGLFAMAVVVTSALLWAFARIFQRFDKRAEQWPALWATALLLSILIPMAGLSARALPLELLPSYSAPLAWAVPLEPLLAPLSESSSRPAEGRRSILAIYSDAALWAVLMIYGLGVLFHTVRLIRGRMRVRTIITVARSLGYYKGTEVILSRQAPSPFAWSRIGLTPRRFIVLPDLYVQQMSPEQIQDILRHEYAHLERGDDEVGLILRTLFCVGWISPFAHDLFARWSDATELRCDMAVTAEQTPEMRRAYAKTLTQALHIMAGRVRQYPTAAFSTSRLRTEKMRLTHILTGTRPAFKRGRDRICLIAAALGLSLGGTFGIAATATAETPAAKTKQWVQSDIVAGRLTARFGQAFDPFKQGTMRDHHGVDIAASIGTPIYAPASGTIRAATELYQGKPGYGTVVVIETEGGVTTLFSHLDAYDVEEGQTVSKGQKIATVGNSGRSTGPHVHIETYRSGQRIDPMTVWDLSAD